MRVMFTSVSLLLYFELFSERVDSSRRLVKLTPCACLVTAVIHRSPVQTHTDLMAFFHVSTFHFQSVQEAQISRLLVITHSLSACHLVVK